MDIPPAAVPLLPPLAVPKVREDELTEKLAEDEEMQEVPPDTTITPGASSSSRDEKRTEAQEATSVKKRLTTKSSTEKRTAMFADQPVKRRLTRETDTKNNEVHRPVEIEDSYLW